MENKRLYKNRERMANNVYQIDIKIEIPGHREPFPTQHRLRVTNQRRGFETLTVNRLRTLRRFR